MALIAIVGIQHWIHYDNAATRAANDARQTENQIVAECVVSSALAKCAREIEQASRAEQRDEYDLYSQQAMALWTSVMGSMAILGVALSAFGVYLVWRTWDATRDAAESSRKTLRAFIAKERAFLIPQNVSEASAQEFDGTITNGFVVSLFNGGSAPGTVILTQWSIVDQPFWPEGFDNFDNNVRAIMQNAKGRTPFMPEDVEFKVGQIRYLVGVVTYKTLESEKFTSPFASRLTRIESEWGPERFEFAECEIHGMPYHT